MWASLQNRGVDGKFDILSLIMIYASFSEAWFAYVFPKHINIDNSTGDVSYGVYIYAWYVQQIVAQFFPGLNPYAHTLVATPLVCGLAYASWNLIEKPALGLKKNLMVFDINYLRARLAALS